MKTDVVIIGGGLSGLATARLLSQQNINFMLLEARERIGGRIHSEVTDTSSDIHSAVDLGPSWFWPGQHRIEKLIHELALDEAVFEQYHLGNSVIEYSNGQLEVGHGSASMAGSLRLHGGLIRLVNTLSESIPTENILTGTCVTDVKRMNDKLHVGATRATQVVSVQTNKVILALPPRLAANNIQFEPTLADNTLVKLQTKSTWMAAQSKFVAVYDSPFWRDNGLSGDGLSQKGPLVEIHDASANNGSFHALFGFIGIPASHRDGQQELITQHALSQINRMFGDGGTAPVSTYYKDWAFDAFTSHPSDRESQPHGHGPAVSFENEWNDTLVFSGTETAKGTGQSNGYLEGALESAERAAESVNK